MLCSEHKSSRAVFQAVGRDKRISRLMHYRREYLSSAKEPGVTMKKTRGGERTSE